MLSIQRELSYGDLIQIRYRACPQHGEAGHDADRWIAAEIIDCEPGAWPLARLADGQLTEVRRFMDWRSIRKTKQLAALPLSA